MEMTTKHRRSPVSVFLLLGGLLLSPHAAVAAQARPPQAQPPKAAPPKASPAAGERVNTGITPPAGYTIGADDLLTIRFWGDANMSVDVVVRPDGNISVPLLNDVPAIGMTPEALNLQLEKAASKFIADPDVTVMVREIRSRKVYVIGQGVAKQGFLPLNGEMNVLQALAASGGLLEYAKKDDIVIIRKENGSERRFKFNFSDVVKGKKTEQNIALQPGDTVLVE